VLHVYYVHMCSEASHPKERDHRRTLDVRGLARRRDSSRLDDDMQRLAGIGVPSVPFSCDHMKRDKVKHATSESRFGGMERVASRRAN
jgi:hypothetical protein